jgi:radical SAM superfamily enzyme YgiQ (UPF0313 family)
MKLPTVTFVAMKSNEGLSFGQMYLSAVLKRAGVTVRLLQAEDSADLVRQFGAAPTEVAAFTVTTGLHAIFARWALRLKERFPVQTVAGGPHPTYFPDFLDYPGVDAVCLGEGEESFPEYLSASEGARPPSVPVRGFRHQVGGEVLDGGLRPPVADLDTLPSPDWPLYFDASPALARHPVKSFLATRGCPYRCTYCFNRELNARHRELGAAIVRVRDPELVVEEIAQVRARWGARLIWFLDANFACNLRWLKAFLPRYRQRIGLPFFCKLRPNVVTDALADALVEAGCTSVGLGIEAGNEHLRRTVLDRQVSDEAIVRASHAFVDRGALVMSFNMVGLPGETYAMARETLDLNVAARVDYAMTMFLQPYPGTEIARIAQRLGLFDGRFDALSSSYFQPSPIRFPSPEDRRRVTNLQRLMALSVAYPEVRRHVDLLTRVPENRFYLELFKAFNHHAFHRRFYRAYTLLHRPRP